VFDWSIPREWNIRDAFIKDRKGERVVDFRNSNLHVLNYSVPVRGKFSREELSGHIFTIPGQPDRIPYRTSYYRENWGFCVSQRQWECMTEEEYEVCIDSSLEDGSLSYGEFLLDGDRDEEVLFSCHICHPSLCNDNLSGVALTTFLAKALQGLHPRYSYRFLFIPGTIGAIAWLARNEAITRRVRHGLVVACVGDTGAFHYKRSRRGNAEIDRAVEVVLKESGKEHRILDFTPYGYDERQYCSPGFNLSVGSLTRTPHGRYPEYHTSADDLDLVRPECLEESLSIYLDVVNVLEANRRYVNLNPKCEPQLGKRGLYQAIGGRTDTAAAEMAMLWVLNLSDGTHSLLDICRESGLKFRDMASVAKILCDHDLLRETRDS
jgi:aminopeptidase-like protein